MYTDITKQDLMRLARDRGLPAGGNKTELMARLEQYDAELDGVFSDLDEEPTPGADTPETPPGADTPEPTPGPQRPTGTPPEPPTEYRADGSDLPLGVGQTVGRDFLIAYPTSRRDPDTYNRHMQMVSQTVAARATAGLDVRLPRRINQYPRGDAMVYVYSATIRRNRRR